MTSATLVAELPPLTVLPDGSIRVTGTRVLLELVVAAYNDGMSAEEIAAEYTTLNVAEVYGVVGYYLHHREELAAYCEEVRNESEEIQAMIETNPRNTVLRDRLWPRKVGAAA